MLDHVACGPTGLDDAQCLRVFVMSKRSQERRIEFACYFGKAGTWHSSDYINVTIIDYPIVSSLVFTA